MCRPCFSLELVTTVKCGLRTSIQFSGLSRAMAITAASTGSSSKKKRFDIMRAITNTPQHRASQTNNTPESLDWQAKTPARFGFLLLHGGPQIHFLRCDRHLGSG